MFIISVTSQMFWPLPTTNCVDQLCDFSHVVAFAQNSVDQLCDFSRVVALPKTVLIISVTSQMLCPLPTTNCVNHLCDFSNVVAFVQNSVDQL